MEIRTIKLEKGNYTNFNDEFNLHDVIIMNGARGAGKSYPTAKYVSSILENDETAKFVYMRNLKDELPTYAGWCSDLNLTKIAGCEIVRLERGKPTMGDITLFGEDENGNVVFERIIGKCMSLENSHKYKSGKYDEFKVIVFEEYSHLKMNATSEKTYCFNFLENVVTVFRDRPKKIFLLSNSLRTIPLLETAIEEMTGELFFKPIKFKIFRKNKANKQNEFLAYLNGELYKNDGAELPKDEFLPIHSNKQFILLSHKFLRNTYYIKANNLGIRHTHRKEHYIELRNFVERSAVNQFYYPDFKTERNFTCDYVNFTSEVRAFLCDYGYKFY